MEVVKRKSESELLVEQLDGLDELLALLDVLRVVLLNPSQQAGDFGPLQVAEDRLRPAELKSRSVPKMALVDVEGRFGVDALLRKAFVGLKDSLPFPFLGSLKSALVGRLRLLVEMLQLLPALQFFRVQALFSGPKTYVHWGAVRIPSALVLQSCRISLLPQALLLLPFGVLFSMLLSPIFEVLLVPLGQQG